MGRCLIMNCFKRVEPTVGMQTPKLCPGLNFVAFRLRAKVEMMYYKNVLSYSTTVAGIFILLKDSEAVPDSNTATCICIGVDLAPVDTTIGIIDLSMITLQLIEFFCCKK